MAAATRFTLRDEKNDREEEKEANGLEEQHCD